MNGTGDGDGEGEGADDDDDATIGVTLNVSRANGSALCGQR